MPEQNADAVLEQAERLRVEGQYSEAMALYEQLLAADPDHLPARSGLAHCLLNTGEFDACLEHFRMAADSHPIEVQPRLLYAMTLLMLGSFDEGQQELRRVLEMDPENLEARKQLRYFEGGDL